MENFSNIAVLLLCAGYGKRLNALTGTNPKPLVPFCNVPLLNIHLRNLKAVGLKSIAINTHHLAHKFSSIVKEESLYESFETTLLDTGGAIAAIASWAAGRTLIVINSDILVEPTWDKAIASHMARDADSTLVVLPSPLPGERPLQCHQNQIRIIGDGPHSARDTLTPRGFACIQILSPRFLKLFQNISPFRVFDLYETVLSTHRIEAYVFSGYWNEIGTPERYFSAHIQYLDLLDQGLDPLRLLTNPLFNSTFHSSKDATDLPIQGPTIVPKSLRIPDQSRLGAYTVVNPMSQPIPQGLTTDHAILLSGGIPAGIYKQGVWSKSAWISNFKL